MLNLHDRMNQWCGINSLAYFLPITFERNIGLSTNVSLIVSGVLGMQYFMTSWLFVHLVRGVLWTNADKIPALTSSSKDLAVAKC